LRAVKIITAALLTASLAPAVQTTAQTAQAGQAAAQTRPSFAEWGDDFGGGKLEVKDGQVRLRSPNGSRAGIRSRQTFSADRFSVEARLAKVGPQMLEPGNRGAPLGFGSLTILFDGSGRNRIEWILTSEGTFEAWSVVDGRGERLDDRNLGTKIKNPVIAIIRRGDEFLFVLNGPDSPPEAAQIGIRKTIKNMPRSFTVMLYGFGSSENNWDSIRVVTPK
jgi:hypothetical protein